MAGPGGASLRSLAKQDKPQAMRAVAAPAAAVSARAPAAVGRRCRVARRLLDRRCRHAGADGPADRRRRGGDRERRRIGAHRSRAAARRRDAGRLVRAAHADTRAGYRRPAGALRGPARRVRQDRRARRGLLRGRRVRRPDEPAHQRHRADQLVSGPGVPSPPVLLARPRVHARLHAVGQLAAGAGDAARRPGDAGGDDALRHRRETGVSQAPGVDRRRVGHAGRGARRDQGRAGVQPDRSKPRRVRKPQRDQPRRQHRRRHGLLGVLARAVGDLDRGDSARGGSGRLVGRTGPDHDRRRRGVPQLRSPVLQRDHAALVAVLRDAVGPGGRRAGLPADRHRAARRRFARRDSSSRRCAVESSTAT